METIFKNGNILTMDETTPRAEALAVHFGRICQIENQGLVSVRDSTTILAGLESQLLPT